MIPVRIRLFHSLVLFVAWLPLAAVEVDRLTTPETLPGAETFIYHDVQPEAMRLHVFKPAGWQATDQHPALIHFFGGGFLKG